MRSNLGILLFAQTTRRLDPDDRGDSHAVPLEWSSHPADASFSGPVPSGVGLASNQGERKWGFNLGGFGLGRYVFEFSSSGKYQGVWHYQLKVPHWFASLVLAGPAAYCLFRRYKNGLRQTRIREGLCANCGYDLRASKDRCPECGTAIPPGAAEKGVAG